MSFYTIDEEKLILKILDLSDNSFIFKKRFDTEYLAKLHFRKKQNLIFVLLNPNKNKRLRVMTEFHCINCKDEIQLGKDQAKKSKINPEDILDLTKRVRKVRKFLDKIEKKGRKYKRKQKRILKQIKKSHRKTYWLVSFELLFVVATNIIQIIFIKNRIISKNI